MGGFMQVTALLEELTAVLRDLTDTQHGIATAVRTDDLEALGDGMKREQALSLSLRSIDQRRTVIQKALGIETIAANDLPAHAPDAQTCEATRLAVRALADQYKIMQSASEVARSALECSLHSVEQQLGEMGVDPKLTEEVSRANGAARADIRA